MTEPRVLETWDVPSRTASEAADPVLVRVEAKTGEVITVVGSNGSGKSALASWMVLNCSTEIRRVLAQRRVWFEHAGPSITPADRESMKGAFLNWDRDPSSRYIDRGDSQRSSVALFDLLGKHNSENQKAVSLYDSGATTDVVSQEIGMRLLPTMNKVLGRAGIHTIVNITDQQTFTATHRDLGVTYPISQMSDGERSALLLSAEVLTAPVSVVVVIDEPERHLHRAISAGLIEALVNERSDCAFVVLTHDLDLASRLSVRPGRTLATAGVHWVNNAAASWEIHEVADEDELPESARNAILGGRERILFIEGSKSSIDLTLYELLFPGWSLVPSGGCDEVIRAVSGLKASVQHHWVEARGLVDRDGRTPEECAALLSKNVHALPVSEVENFYYISDVVKAVATKQAATLGGSADDLTVAAMGKVTSELAKPDVLNRLAKKLAKDALARKLLAHMPDKVEDDEDVTFSIPSPLPGIRAELESLLASNDYDGLIKAVPIRDTKMRGDLANVLGFKNHKDYQRAATRCVAESSGLAAGMASGIGLPAQA
ncbi:AAA family ATPase [Rhodococcoides corynebacterioides]|uniref:AAA family ATPase n=1 Tax=Rhodococcoides corynebacterioides TaxID=53972 RepID=UPI003AE443D9